MTNIIKNNSKGYGYDYASLTDIAKQGYTIPKMKIESEFGETEEEFVYYYDAELKDWFKGAKIVIPESKGMNKAQLYGAALTYARRYTTLMALQLCCGDDNEIENIKEDGTKKETKNEYNPETDDGEPATPKQLEVLNKLTDKQKENIINHYGLDTLNEISKAQAKEVISRLTKK